jgi:hypothetical protein
MFAEKLAALLAFLFTPPFALGLDLAHADRNLSGTEISDGN